MKTLINNLFSIRLIAMLMIVFPLTIACNAKQEQESAGKGTQASKTVAPETDIHTATFMGNMKAIRQHIEAKTDLDQKDAYGSTPLIIAATFGKTDVAALLLEGGADPDVVNNDGSTALHTAAFLCRTEIVKLLLENGADKTIRNNFGSTALESVSGSFGDVRPVYEQFSKDLGPLGLKLDFDQLEKTRPEIAALLQ